MHVFEDENRKEWRSDRDKEARWMTVGLVDSRLYVVFYCYRGESIRLISARQASRREKGTYYGNH